MGNFTTHFFLSVARRPIGSTFPSTYPNMSLRAQMLVNISEQTRLGLAKCARVQEQSAAPVNKCAFWTCGEAANKEKGPLLCCFKCANPKHFHNKCGQFICFSPQFPSRKLCPCCAPRSSSPPVDALAHPGTPPSHKPMGVVERGVVEATSESVTCAESQQASTVSQVGGVVVEGVAPRATFEPANLDTDAVSQGTAVSPNPPPRRRSTRLSVESSVSHKRCRSSQDPASPPRSSTKRQGGRGAHVSHLERYRHPPPLRRRRRSQPALAVRFHLYSPCTFIAPVLYSPCTFI